MTYFISSPFLADPDGDSSYACNPPRRRGGVATQRPAKPFTPVRFRSAPCSQPAIRVGPSDPAKTLPHGRSPSEGVAMADETPGTVDDTGTGRPTVWIALTILFALAAIGLAIWGFSKKSDLDDTKDKLAQQEQQAGQTE